MNKSNNIQIYVAYHNDDLIDEYELNTLDNNIYLPLNTSMHYGDLHFYLNENVSHYYVLKNKPECDVIGFCHYRRYFDLTNINFDNVVNKNKIVVIYSGESVKSYLCGFCYTLEDAFKNKLIGFLRDNNVKLIKPYDYYEQDREFSICACSMYVAKRETALYIEKVIFDFLKFICGDFENDITVFDKFSNRYERHIAYALEQIRGFLLCNIDYKSSKVEHHIKNKNYIYTLKVGDENEIRYVQKLYKIKLKEGINLFYVIKNDINIENFYDLDFKYLYNFVEIVNNINEIERLDNNIYIEV